jgi:hypothetical protein
MCKIIEKELKQQIVNWNGSIILSLDKTADLVLRIKIINLGNDDFKINAQYITSDNTWEKTYATHCDDRCANIVYEIFARMKYAIY